MVSVKKDAGLAVEALAALSSTENFSNVALRKAEGSTAYAMAPFTPLMLLHIKGE